MVGEGSLVCGNSLLGKEMREWLKQQRVLSQRNCLPDSHMGGLLECKIDLEQGYTGNLAVL